MRRTVTLAAATAAAVTAAVLGAAPSASAGLTTYCVGTGGAVTVPNDLYVPPGESCALTGTIITGNVAVAAGANLVVDGGRVDGLVEVASDGYLDARNSTVRGDVVVASGGYGVYLQDSDSGSVTVRAKGSSTINTFLFADASTITGSVNAAAGDVRLDRGTTVTGSLSTNGSYYTDLHDSFVDGALSVLNSGAGSVVCGSAVAGRSTFSGNVGGVQVGPNGTLDSCASGGYFGADVSVTNTTGGVTIEDNIINGALTVQRNTPTAQVAANNRIRGGVVGDPAAPSAQRRAAAAAADRDAKAQDRADRRHTAAVDEAEAAGAARL
ncbi:MULTISPECIES: hypothetical protein [Catenuloplanes]|uniref:Uncharacterized protein n=1 Tax=Catenuloplanes niger TaxID=587534 RepID=A0AAE3ZKG1_9ACTN|nr:hypothetical protein [Catenuloplanes niger]MDR7320346.1 hypothetical protein [Catenuloplanes niger]